MVLAWPGPCGCRGPLPTSSGSRVAAECPRGLLAARPGAVHAAGPPGCPWPREPAMPPRPDTTCVWDGGDTHGLSGADPKSLSPAGNWRSRGSLPSPPACRCGSVRSLTRGARTTAKSAATGFPCCSCLSSPLLRRGAAPAPRSPPPAAFPLSVPTRCRAVPRGTPLPAPVSGGGSLSESQFDRKQARARHARGPAA